MLSLHLPLASCDKFGYDFPCGIFDAVGDYGLRHMCLHCIRSSCHFLSVAGRGISVRSMRGDYTEILQFQCSCRAVSTSFHGNRTEPVRLPCGFRAEVVRRLYDVFAARSARGLRAMSVLGLCNATYDNSTGCGLAIFKICITLRLTKS